jgi:predicted amidohydrolase YtcJ
MSASRRRLIVADRIFTADPAAPWAEAVVVDDGLITFVGGRREATALAGAAERIETPGVALPGFVDAHAHVLMTGDSLLRAQLRDAPDLATIRERLVDWRSRNPDAPRVLGLGWLFSSLPDGQPHRSQLDDLFPDIPVYLSASDLHSTWANTAALDELGITDDTPDPVGGRFVRDAAGHATGLLLEMASFQYVMPLLLRADEATHDRRLAAAIGAYHECGVTAAVDMAFDDDALAAVQRAERAGTLTAKVGAHWIIHRSGDADAELAQVHLAAEHCAATRGARGSVVGVKLIVDGTIDGCTAATINPYADGTTAEPIWDDASLRRIVTEADRLGMQIALHAIGDAAVRSAIDALELAIIAHGTHHRRHRIEHLEYTDPADMGRLKALGITASMQPVHCDPAGLVNWRAMLGDERAEHGFAWQDFLAHDTTLAFGTDTPTAPHLALRNMYIAATRRSPEQPELDAYRPEQAVRLAEAITFGTRHAAWASHFEDRIGSIRPGLAADLVLLDRDPFDADPQSLLDAEVVATLADGEIVHDSRGR